MKVVVGPVFGFIMAKITVFWLVNVFNDALTEITITLASTYITFYLGELLCTFSVQGILTLNALKYFYINHGDQRVFSI